ncbi:UNVERIFIED_CONTAM: hypothetical protein Slati_3486400 [Sesamum latifolium]|uniref:Reverse transcriptase domain-containing protein n=1 Tax=Sesamum latifolium TaxID=2727402 RepID=A0AAW2UGS1_9LAMI
MPRSFTATTITLIPKIDSPQTWSDFRPIFLYNVTNKIMTKLSYNKLAPVLPTLISPSQSGFVPGRLIGDNILMVQELTHSLDLRYSKGNVILELDMSKAYDRLRWKFLYSVMSRMGFPRRFMHLIKQAVKSCLVYYAFKMVKLLAFFKSTHGFRQGDPISPSLFIIAAEALF